MDVAGGRAAVSAASSDPRPARRQARFEKILAAAWDVANEQGLAAVSLHEVARRVGLRQPSLYAYIKSKMALYDAMFAQAGEALVDHMNARTYSAEPRRAVRDACSALFEYSGDNPAANQLLFDRTIPGFEPSSASFAAAVEFYTFMVAKLTAAGVTDAADVDIFTALIGGLSKQQETNEPGGNRWIRHLDTILGMFFSYIDSQPNMTPALDTRSSADPGHPRPTVEGER